MSTPSTPRDSRDVPQMHKRSLHHDYHGRGIYLITLCTEGRQPLLGKLTGSSLEEAVIEPTALGREVLRCWDQIPAIQRQLAEKKIAKLEKKEAKRKQKEEQRAEKAAAKAEKKSGRKKRKEASLEEE